MKSSKIGNIFRIRDTETAGMGAGSLLHVNKILLGQLQIGCLRRRFDNQQGI